MGRRKASPSLSSLLYSTMRKLREPSRVPWSLARPLSACPTLIYIGLHVSLNSQLIRMYGHGSQVDPRGSEADVVLTSVPVVPSAADASSAASCRSDVCTLRHREISCTHLLILQFVDHPEQFPIHILSDVATPHPKSRAFWVDHPVFFECGSLLPQALKSESVAKSPGITRSWLSFCVSVVAGRHYCM
jgi:hypothetical protein